MPTFEENLVTVCERNYGVILAQVEGVTHDESVRQLPFRGNCMNWVIGHLIASHDDVLRVLGLPPTFREDERRRYARESAPITQSEEALPFADLLRTLATSQERLLTALRAATPDELAVKNERGQTTGERAEFLLWHQAYHIGQLELLRQLAGKNDKVI
jgi:hypothetical protein